MHRGPPGARTYWCTGYKANSAYLKDSRTDADITSELDPDGFVVVGKDNRMSEAKVHSRTLSGSGPLWTLAPLPSGGRACACLPV